MCKQSQQAWSTSAQDSVPNREVLSKQSVAGHGDSGVQVLPQEDADVKTFVCSDEHTRGG